MSGDERERRIRAYLDQLGPQDPRVDVRGLMEAKVDRELREERRNAEVVALAERAGVSGSVARQALDDRDAAAVAKARRDALRRATSVLDGHAWTPLAADIIPKLDAYWRKQARPSIRRTADLAGVHRTTIDDWIRRGWWKPPQ